MIKTNKKREGIRLMYKTEGVNSENKMNKFNLLLITVLVGVLFVLSLSVTTAQYTKTNFYSPLGGIGSFTGGFFGQTPGQFDRSMCEAGQDFVLQIAPFGCSPAVVRSDLLEEQNVPIYCQIAATQINPLVDVKAIDYMTFSGQTPPEVAGVGFHPNKAALGTGRSNTLDNYPVLDNIGYAVIVLKRQPNESALTNCKDSKLLGLDVGEVCVVEGNLTAKIRYNIENAWGVGQASYYLPLLNDNEFEDRYKAYGFWDGRGFLKAESIGIDGASISIYAGRTNAGGNLQRLNNVQLQEGATSDKLYMTGFNYCLANLRLRLDKIDFPDTRAKIRVNADIYEVADEGEFLDGKCKVLSIEKYGINEEVEIRCREDTNAGLFGSKPFTLKMAPKINLEVNGQVGSYGLGDFVGLSNENVKDNPQLKRRVYVGYIGSVDDKNTPESLKIFLITTDEQTERLNEDTLDEIANRFGPIYDKSTSSSDAGSFISNLFSQVFGGIYRGIRFVITGEDIDGLFYSEGMREINRLNIKINGFAGAVNAELNEQTREYYQKAMDDYDEVLDSFASEQYNSVVLGKDTFKKKINFASLMQQKRTVVELCEEFTEAYPNEAGFFICSNAPQLANDVGSTRHVTINGKVKEISFEGVYSPSFKEYGVAGFVRDNVNNREYPFELRKGKKIDINVTTGEYVELTTIKDENSADLTIKLNSQQTTTAQAIISAVSTGRKNIPLGVQIAVNERYTITISKINLQRVAKVSVLPNIDYAGTETTFKFRVGIEKRSDLLKLSPEQARDKINSLDADIKRWEDISSKLGSVVKGLKTACLATGALFTVDNLLANLDGKGIARQKVMRNSGGWYERCTTLKNQGEYSSVQKCLFENSDKIDADVERYSKLQTAQNQELKSIRKVVNNGGLFSEDVVDQTALIQNYSARVRNALGSCAGETIENPLKSGESINVNNVKTALSFESWAQRRNYNFEELRDIGFYCKVVQENPSDESAKQRLYSLLYGVNENSKGYAEATTFATNLGIPSSQVGFIPLGQNIKTYDWLGATYAGIKTSIPAPGNKDSILFQGLAESNPVYVTGTTLGKYILVLDDTTGGNNLPVKKTADDKLFMVYDEAGNLVSNPPKEFQGGIYFTKLTSGSYTTEWKNPIVRYHETEPFKGAPALVPVEPAQGWYAGLKQTLPVGGNIRSFDESGRVYSYYLCNVGADGQANFFEEGFGGDRCQMIVTGSEVTFTNFAGLSQARIKNLVDKATVAIASAQRQYSSGVQRVNIPGITEPVKVEAPAVNIPQIECEDIMSPQQCRILFNVCDPVICPSSRCNLGGAYPVADVVQTGVVGSIALCLPNIQEGIVLPVCLTGVKAGIDNWASIKKSYKSCLEEQLETGKTVGICDEIQSIYACEFFWRQSVPLAKIIVPTVISTVLGQNVRGGGEYLGVADAFSKAEKSVEYFTQIYGEDSFRAFKARSTDEIGGEVCKSFVSGVYPSGGNFLDTLTEPDSPPQFTGRFDEIPFTTATNPPVSHYKVFYHIFAGKDSGAYFRVYLKGSPGSSYYQDTNIARVVGYGYIPRGEQESKTVDFTAPSGYNQMCILVNGQEECGFKQVSTDFTVNYIQDEYAKSQAETPVTSEAECISGTPSLYNLINPNLQEGIGDVINPELYNRGIYRICATDNPGQATGPARWADVGYCGDQKLRCWLDMQSVKDVIKNSNIEGDTVENLNKRIQADLEAKGDAPNFKDTLTEIENTKKDIDKIKIITDVIGKFVFNYQKGWLLMMRGDAFGNLALGLFKEDTDKKTLSPTQPDEEGEETTEQVLEERDKVTLSGLNPPKIASPLWPARVRIVRSSDINLPLVGDIGDVLRADYIYEWSDVSWRFRNDGVVISKETVKSSYEEGLSQIIKKVREEETAGRFSRVEVQCGSKLIIAVDKFSLFETNVIEKIDETLWKNCADPSVSPSTSGDFCTTREECQKLLGLSIIETARKIKQEKGISDNIVNQQTGAKNFECLALQLAYHESKISQCGINAGGGVINDFQRNGDPLYCNGGFDGTLKSPGDEKSYGIMQININEHPNAKVHEFLENVDYGVDYLFRGYNTASREFTCTGKTYSGWTRALRNYNGWGCIGDNNYVENVINYKDEIEALFPECR